jgi:hypothetical protein
MPQLDLLLQAAVMAVLVEMARLAALAVLVE